MAKKRSKEWEIDEWDESLDVDSSSGKGSFTPATSENWGAAGDEWDEDLLPQKPAGKPKKNRIPLAGGIAAAVVLLAVLLGGRSVPGTGTTVTKAPVTAAVTRQPVTFTQQPTRQPTRPPTQPPTVKPTDTAAPLPESINCSWYGEEMRYYYHQLSKKEQACFKLLYNGIADFRDSVVVDGTGCTMDEVKRAVEVLRNDCPELFQTDGSVSYSSIGGKIHSVNLEYCMQRGEYERRCGIIREAVKEIRRSISNPNDDYNVEMAVYRWLIHRSEYLIKADNSTARADSAICDGKAQCAGYAASLSLLLRTLGVKCFDVTSIPAENHRWNMVKIRGEWYNCDVTWDDHEELTEVRDEFFCYCNVPDRLMSGHTPEQDGFSRPACNSITANYTYLDGIYISSGGMSDAVRRIESEIRAKWSSGQRRFMIMLDDRSLYQKAVEICNKITLPDRTGFVYYYKDETRCLYIIAEVG